MPSSTFSFVACLVGDIETVRHCFQIAAPSAHFRNPNTDLDDAVADVVVNLENSNTDDVISVSFRGRNSLHLCDVVILACDSASQKSVEGVHSLVGRAGSDAPSLPPNVPIVLLDFGTLSSSFPYNNNQQQQSLHGATGADASISSNNAAAAAAVSSPDNRPSARSVEQQQENENNNEEEEPQPRQPQQQQQEDENDNQDYYDEFVGKDPSFADMYADLQTVVRYAGSAYLNREESGSPSSAFVSLITTATNAVRCPRHILWDGRALTEEGRQALRRSFWLLDEDGDGTLNDAEISKWHRMMYGTFSTDDVNTMKAYARNTESSYIAAGTAMARNRLVTEDDQVTVLGYLAVCHIMLAEERHEPLWVMLGAHGIGPDGRPYTEEEIDKAILCSDTVESMLHLSSSGTSFFASLYSRQRFSHPSDLFLFTPDCPWSTIYGLPNACEVDLPVHDFISCWRFMAVTEPATVAKFACYWAYPGESLSSLFVSCKMRPFRSPTNYIPSASVSSISGAISSLFSSSSSSSDQKNDAAGGGGDARYSPPPTAIFLVLGSPQSGKTSLCQRIADNDSGTVFADDLHPSGRAAATATVRARIGNDGDILIAMRELDESEVDSVLANKRFMNTVSGILFCFDTSEPYSLSYLSRVYPRLAAAGSNLPIVLAMCKCDLPVVDQLGIPEGPKEFCLQRGIMWPPVFTSLSHLRALPGDLLNDVDNLTFILAEVAVNPSLVLDGSLSGQDGSSSSGSSGTVGFLRTLKRAVVLAGIGIATFKLTTHVWKRYSLGRKYPQVEETATSISNSVSSLLPASAGTWLAGKLLVTSGAETASTSTQTSASRNTTTITHIKHSGSSGRKPMRGKYTLGEEEQNNIYGDLKFHPEYFHEGEAPKFGEHHVSLKGGMPKRMWANHSDWN